MINSSIVHWFVSPCGCSNKISRDLCSQREYSRTVYRLLNREIRVKLLAVYRASDGTGDRSLRKISLI